MVNTINAVIPILAPLMWLTVLLLFVFKPEDAILFSIGVEAILVNLRTTIVPVFQIGDISIQYQDGFTVALVLFFCIRQLLSLVHGIPRSKVRITSLKILFFWIGFQTLRGIFLINGASTIRQASVYFVPILYCFVLPSILKEKKQVKRFMLGILYIAIITVVLNFVYFYFLGGIAQGGHDWRAQLRFIDSYQVILAGIGFTSILLFLLSNQATGKLKSYAGMVVFATAILVTQFRTIWVAVVIGTLMVIIWTRRLIKSVGLGILVSLFILGLILWINGLAQLDFTTAVKQNITGILNEGVQEERTWAFRVKLWEEIISTMQGQWIMGDGLGDYIYVLRGGVLYPTIVHNDYLAYTSYFGLVGLGLLILTIGYWYANLWRYVKLEAESYYKCLGVVLLVAVLMCMVFALTFLFVDLFWLSLGLGIALVRGRADSMIILQKSEHEEKIE